MTNETFASDLPDFGNGKQIGVAASPEMLATNIIALPRPQKLISGSRFKTVSFKNPSGATVWRVTGSKRDGERIRHNFKDEAMAKAFELELELEWRNGNGAMHEPAVRATMLNPVQLALAQSAFCSLGAGADQEMPLAIDFWIKHGRQRQSIESPRLSEAVTQFKSWLETSKHRDRTKDNLRTRISMFESTAPDLRVSDITPDTIDNFLSTRNGVSARTRENDRLAISKFFSWCIERPRRWINANPCHAVHVEQDEKGDPIVLSIAQCEQLLRRAEKFKRGRLIPYITVCMFAGIRPSEAERADRKTMLKLADRKLKLPANVTKTKRGRTVKVCQALTEWLKAYKGPFYPSNWRKDFDALRTLCGFGNNEGQTPWTADVFRHTAISHFFNETQSYGATAKQHGNSESVIREHYDGNVSEADTKKFYALRPKARSRAR